MEGNMVKKTRQEIEQKLEAVADEMLNASVVRDEAAYYASFEEQGELRHMLEEFRSDASEDD
jgi:hypothetical protein